MLTLYQMMLCEAKQKQDSMPCAPKHENALVHDVGNFH